MNNNIRVGFILSVIAHIAGIMPLCIYVIHYAINHTAIPGYPTVYIAIAICLLVTIITNIYALVFSNTGKAVTNKETVLKNISHVLSFTAFAFLGFAVIVFLLACIYETAMVLH